MNFYEIVCDILAQNQYVIKTASKSHIYYAGTDSHIVIELSGKTKKVHAYWDISICSISFYRFCPEQNWADAFVDYKLSVNLADPNSLNQINQWIFRISK